ncbi:MAG: redoxin [Methylophilaceae bacterium]|nr:MAG: redoxin [Methylophilaceae bacterium]
MLNKLVSPIGAILLILCIGIATSYIMAEKTIEQKVNNAPTAELFATTLPDENGKPQALSQWKGKIIVLNFWATWCPPCREEMPELSALNTAYQDKNVIVIGIALDEIGLIKEFNTENNMSYPLLAAEETGGQLAFDLGNDKSALPYTVIIKPDGTIANTYFGRISKALLEETLIKLL